MKKFRTIAGFLLLALAVNVVGRLIAPPLAWAACTTTPNLGLLLCDDGTTNWNQSYLIPNWEALDLSFSAPLVRTGTAITSNAASASLAGHVTTSAQTFAGAKTFNGGVVVADGTYLQAGDFGTADPTAGDCDDDAERFRLYHETDAPKLWVCTGATGWASVDLVIP